MTEMNELVANCDLFKMIKYATISMVVLAGYSIAVLLSVLNCDVERG